MASVIRRLHERATEGPGRGEAARSRKDLGDRLAEAGVVVGDHELDA